MTATYELMQQVLSSETHFNVLEDLIEFTGLSEEEVIKRVIRNPKTIGPMVISASGWFDEEYDFYKPKSEAELRWFYGQSDLPLLQCQKKCVATRKKID
jgi:hypothetical protein